MHLFGSWSPSRAVTQPGVWWRSPTTGTLRLSAIPEGPEDAGPSTSTAAAAPGADEQHQQPAGLSPCPSSTHLEGSSSVAASSGRPPVEEACAWALHIRHFTDCVPLDSFPLESLCSMNLDTEDLDQSACGDASVELQAASSPCKAWGSSHLQQQQQLDPVKAACQLLGTSAGGPIPTPATGTAAAAGGSGRWQQQRQDLSQQRVQAWLLGASPQCPLNTSSCSSTGGGMVGGVGGSSPGTPHTPARTMGLLSRSFKQQQQQQQQGQQQPGGSLCIPSPPSGFSSSSTSPGGQLVPAAALAAAAAGRTHVARDAAAAAALLGDDLPGVSSDDMGVWGDTPDDTASFDAPEWWQAAVVERWSAQRQEFSRSWVKRALMWMQLTAAKTTPNLVNS